MNYFVQLLMAFQRASLKVKNVRKFKLAELETAEYMEGLIFHSESVCIFFEFSLGSKKIDNIHKMGTTSTKEGSTVTEYISSMMFNIPFVYKDVETSDIPKNPQEAILSP